MGKVRCILTTERVFRVYSIVDYMLDAEVEHILDDSMTLITAHECLTFLLLRSCVQWKVKEYLTFARTGQWTML